MRALLILALAAPLAGCTAATMAGFDTVAAQPGSERIDITAVPAWKDGSFRVGTTPGTVRRAARSDAWGWGPDRIGSEFDRVEDGLAARYGRMAFEITRPDLGGRVEARCGYSREEIRTAIVDGVVIAAPLEPLRLRCAYRINGQDSGSLHLDAAQVSGAEMADGRAGRIAVDGVELLLSSEHGLAEVVMPVSDAAGYVMARRDGREVGALELTGGSARRAAVSGTPAERRAALLAAITLALFWDPGDVG